MVAGCAIFGRAESGLIVRTPPPGMLNAIVPPPMLLASVIACRSEPPPLSFVFVTVKTKGVARSRASVESRATVAFDSPALRMRAGRVERVVLNALPTLEAIKTELIDNNATAGVIRSAKARGEAFFFILFFWGVCARTTFFYGGASKKFQERM